MAVTRTGTTLNFWLNGTNVGTATTDTTYYSSSTSFLVGTNSTATSGFWNGYISNLRVVKGSRVYTSAFTPTTTPLTAITNTNLLTCQSNRFVDNSSNNLAITRNGDVSIQPFSPFAPTSAYSTSVNGGSMYFDGSGDYLDLPQSSEFAFGTGDFTVEFWAYVTKTNSTPIHGTTSTSNTFGVDFNNTNGATFAYVVGVNSVNWGVLPTLNTWQHHAFVRSGSTLTYYLDGTSQGGKTFTLNYL
jgi:hypothetical protein